MVSLWLGLGISLLLEEVTELEKHLIQVPMLQQELILMLKVITQMHLEIILIQKDLLPKLKIVMNMPKDIII